jgi:hypothetical protein
MQKRGLTAAGTQRWYCRLCHASAVQKRPDTQARHHRTLFNLWLTGNRSLTEISQEQGVTRRTLIRWFTPFWTQPESSTPPPPSPTAIYILDGVYLSGRENAALICRTVAGHLSWQFAQRETRANWLTFLTSLPPPDAVVTDGQKGLLLAIKQLWPEVKIQRCIIHIERLAKIKLTRRPKTCAGKELLSLVQRVLQVRTPRQCSRWLCVYRRWERRHAEFLKQRTERESPVENQRKWWYTHRNLRAARSLIRHALPHLFTFIQHPHIPRTTNHVEGGVNSRLKELLHRHRGLNHDRKQGLVAEFLAKKERQKPPRNVT